LGLRNWEREALGMKITTVKLVLLFALVGGALTGITAPAYSDTLGIRAAFSEGRYVWRPARRAIAVNDRIRWRNPTGVTHNVVAYGGNWSYNKTLSPGTGVRRQFGRRGIFRFRCTFHSVKTSSGCSGMCGRVTVG
jgi:plastocyanin